MKQTKNLSMNITNISVSAGRGFNHPYEQFSNLKLDVNLRAALSLGEDAETAVKALQAKAEKLAEDHKQGLLQSIEELREMSELQREAADLERSLQRSQARLEELRRERPQLFNQPQLTEG